MLPSELDDLIITNWLSTMPIQITFSDGGHK
jgi:hypothetical protein